MSHSLASPRACSRVIEVCVASSSEDRAHVHLVRAQAYGHHLGAQAAQFATLDPADEAEEAVVLLCRDKATGEALGTARITPGGQSAPLCIERSVQLPSHLAGSRRAEVTRLAVVPGADALVKLHLMKAVYHYCVAQDICWLVIAARNEALARNYRRLGFDDLLDAGQQIPLPHAGNIPHFVLTMNVQEADHVWRRARHRLLGFMTAPTADRLPDFRRHRRVSVARPMLAA